MGTFSKPASEFKDIPMVKAQIVAAAKAVGAYAAEGFEVEMEQRLDGNHAEEVYGQLGVVALPMEFDSPLEVAFWIWWRAAQNIDRFCKQRIYLLRHVETEVSSEKFVIDFVVAPVPRSDAAYIDTHWPSIGIELDGHAFHEKTTEQATYRNRRDRLLQQAGWHLFHFSFAEFTKTPEDCLWEVVEFARATYSNLLHQSGA